MPGLVPLLLLLAILVVPLVFVATNRLRMDVAAMSMAAMLGLFQLAGLGMLGPASSANDAIKAISGFSQPVVITLLSLFIITRGLEKSGITRMIAHRLIQVGGQNEGLLIALFTTTTAFLSLFMNNLAAGALVLPSALEVSRRTGIKPSKFLIPVAYGSLLGGAATYFTTANIIVSDLLRIANPPQLPLKILDFTPTGGLIAITGILFLGFFGKRLLPDRQPPSEPRLSSLPEVFAQSLPPDPPARRGFVLLPVIIILAAISFSIAGVPVYLCMLAGALLTVMTGIVTMDEAYRAIEWQAIFLVAGMYAVSLAMVQTGAADLLGRAMLGLVRPLGPLGVAAGAYLLTAILTQFMGGQVTALVTGPVTIAAALSLGANPHAVAVATAIGCSASFLTPMAHPVNIIMVRPANYAFSDFFRAGWLLTILSFVMLLLGLVIFWKM